MRRDPLNADSPAGDAELPWPGAWTVGDVIKTLEPLVGERRRERILAVAAQRLSSVTVLMDAPHDPHNGAALVRSCDAFGIQRLHVVERREPFMVARTIARGSQYWVDVISHPTVDSAVQLLRDGDYRLVATSPDGQLEPADLARIQRLCLIFGNERDGICEALRGAATSSVRVPMRGFVESLNVSVSAAILLHAAASGRGGDIPEAEKRTLYARGLFRSVPRAAEVLEASAADR